MKCRNRCYSPGIALLTALLLLVVIVGNGETPQAAPNLATRGTKLNCPGSVDPTWSSYTNRIYGYEIRYPSYGQVADWTGDGKLICIYLDQYTLLIHSAKSVHVYVPSTGGYVKLESEAPLQPLQRVIVDKQSLITAPFVTYGGFATWDEGINALIEGPEFHYTVTLFDSFTELGNEDGVLIPGTNLVETRLTKLASYNDPLFELLLQILCTFRLLPK